MDFQNLCNNLGINLFDAVYAVSLKLATQYVVLNGTLMATY